MAFGDDSIYAFYTEMKKSLLIAKLGQLWRSTAVGTLGRSQRTKIYWREHTQKCPRLYCTVLHFLYEGLSKFSTMVQVYIRSGVY